MSHASSNKFSKKVKDSYNQNVMKKGIKIPAGVYRGFVINSDDPRQMGRVKVSIARFYGMLDPELVAEVDRDSEYLGAVWCRFMSPFGGTTPAGGTAQRSFGMWGQPPDLDTEVLVAFSGDSNVGIVLGVLPDETRNGSIAGPQSGLDSNGNFTIVQEIPKTRESENQPPEAHPQAEALKTQGLEKDRLRGLNFSNPRRESKSRVMGMSTPDGHAFVMDDGGAEDGTSNLVRLRTAGGAQILMDDTNGFTYIISKDGNSWIEMNRNGDLDVYAQSSINFNTAGDFNINADGNINMQSKLGTNIKSLGVAGIKMHASTGTIDIKAHSNLQIETESNGNLRVAGNYRETASRIDMNGPPALAASTPTATQHTGNKVVKESVATRVPEAEPWNGHLDVQVVDTSSPAGTTDQFASDTYYYQTPANPTAGENTGAYDLGDFPEAETDASGLIQWRAGVDRAVNPKLLELVKQVAKKFGQPLTITSGYRSPNYNASVGGAKKSQHMQGNAVDISGAQFTNDQRLQLVAIASNVGITGIGVYNDKSLHFDIRTGRRSAWGSGFTYAGIAPYAKGTLDKHLANGYA